MPWITKRGGIPDPTITIRNTKTGRYYVRSTVNGPVWGDLDHGRKFHCIADAAEIREQCEGFADTEIVDAMDERGRNMVRNSRRMYGLPNAALWKL